MENKFKTQPTRRRKPEPLEGEATILKRFEAFDVPETEEKHRILRVSQWIAELRGLNAPE
ncbi:hypothetical protein RMR21_015505 [Agrobacterium sp. rho-8.1]